MRMFNHLLKAAIVSALALSCLTSCEFGMKKSKKAVVDAVSQYNKSCPVKLSDQFALTECKVNADTVVFTYATTTDFLDNFNADTQHSEAIKKQRSNEGSQKLIRLLSMNNMTMELVYTNGIESKSIKILPSEMSSIINENN